MAKIAQLLTHENGNTGTVSRTFSRTFYYLLKIPRGNRLWLARWFFGVSIQ